MAGQDVKIRFGGDFSDLEKAFDNAIKKIQADINKIKSPANIMQAQQATAQKATSMGYPMVGPSNDAINRANTLAAAQMRQKTLEEQRGLEMINRVLEKRRAIVDDLKRVQETTTKGTKEEAQVKERLFRAEERERQAKENFARRNATFNTILNAQQQQQQGGGGPPGGGGGGIMGSLTNLIIGRAAIMGAIRTAVQGANAMEGIRKYVSEAPYNARSIGASAFQTQGQGGQRLISFINGGAGEEMLFNPQRLQAGKEADEMMKGRMNSSWRYLTRPLQSIFGARGEPGQEAGAQLGLGTSAMQDRIRQEQNLEKAQLQATQIEALKNGPEGAVRSAVGGKFLQDWQRNLGFQRQTGLSESGFRGFLGGINHAGFTDEQGMGTTSGILGAGGSTRTALGGAGTALRAQRNFNLTNSTDVMGALSGQLGSAQMSEQAMIKVLSEGTRKGVNQADFVEENRKFVQMAANVIGQSNVTSGAGIDQILSTFGKFVTGAPTMRGLEAGKSAYEAYQQQTNIQSGPSATMRAGGMLSHPVLGKLGGEASASLFTMKENDVNVDNIGLQAMANSNPAIVTAAKKAGQSPVEYLVDQYRGVQNKSLFGRQSMDTAVSRVSKAYKGYGPLNTPGAYGSNLDEIKQAEGEALNKIRLEPIAQGLDEQGKLALVRARATGDQSKINSIIEGTQKQMAGEGPGRPGDEMNRQQAEAARMANELFVTIQKSIVPAADAAKQFATDIDRLTAAMRSGNTANIKSAIENLNAGKSGSAPTVPSAGSPGSGTGTGYGYFSNH